MKTKPKISYPRHDDMVIKRLRENSGFVVKYIKSAVKESNEPEVLLFVLRRLAEAHGGTTQVAKKAGITRESLYRALSAKGNPRFSTLTAIAKAVGQKLTTIDNEQADADNN